MDHGTRLSDPQIFFWYSCDPQIRGQKGSEEGLISGIQPHNQTGTRVKGITSVVPVEQGIKIALVADTVQPLS